MPFDALSSTTSTVLVAGYGRKKPLKFKVICNELVRLFCPTISTPSISNIAVKVIGLVPLIVPPASRVIKLCVLGAKIAAGFAFALIVELPNEGAVPVGT
jgi:hypothetical protein